jgi:hypothetical protein
LSASQLWWEGDFRGLPGLDQLENVVVPAFRSDDDPELVAALSALADLLRRHGGRDADVRAALAEAYDIATSRGDWDRVSAVVDQWGDHLAALRDTDALVDLMLRGLDTPGCPWAPDPIERTTTRVAASAADEPVVAERLAQHALATLRARRDEVGAGDMLAALIRAVEVAGRHDDAIALAEQAWTDGTVVPAILNRLSQHLEQAGDDARAAEVCARALARPGRARDAAVLTALRKRHRSCQERLSRSATLFG